MRVYRDYDQAALDAQYNNQATVPDYTVYVRRYAEESRAARNQLRHIAGVAYGAEPSARLDIFPAPMEKAPVLVFLHGGGWQLLSKDDSAFAAPALVAAGACYVALDFPSIPVASLDEIAAQIRAAIAWMHAHIADHGGDPDRLFVAGHSSGAHLAGLLLRDDWQAGLGLPLDVIKGVLLVSGMYDLEPVRLSYRNARLQLDRAAVERNSLLRALPATGCPLVIAYGEHETDEFKRQSLSLFRAWRERKYPARSLQLNGCHHFDVIFDLADPGGALHLLALRQMGLK
ncbi:MAG: alpha/beta hydrolase [Gammaproteobacteria bacterium]